MSSRCEMSIVAALPLPTSSTPLNGFMIPRGEYYGFGK